MGLTQAGRRDSLASHEKHGSHVRRRGAGCAFWVVLSGGSWLSPLTVILPDGTEAIALFSGEEEAQMFCDFLGEEETNPTIRLTTAGTILSLMYCPRLARHVALDPLPGLRGRNFLELLTIDRTRFARRFVSVAPEPLARSARGGSEVRPLEASPTEN